MKVVLIKDLEGKGKKGDILEAEPGFFRNFLLPKGFAVLPESLEAKEILKEKEIKEKKEQIKIDQLKELAKKLEGKKITFTLKEGSKGQIFGSVTASDIASKLEIDKKYIVLEQPVKIKGVHKVVLKFTTDITCQIEVEVKTSKYKKVSS